MCDDARWSKFPLVPYRFSMTESGSATAEHGPDFLSMVFHHCCKHPTEKTTQTHTHTVHTLPITCLYSLRFFLFLKKRYTFKF